MTSNEKKSTESPQTKPETDEEVAQTVQPDCIGQSGLEETACGLVVKEEDDAEWAEY